MLEGLDPKTLKKWLIIAAVVYFVFPFDLIPDFFGLPGRVDDALLIAFSVYFYRSHLRQYLMRGPETRTTGDSRGTGFGIGASKGSSTRDPHAVLGIPRTASAKEIQAAYHARMQEYHPDKVTHLGEELQKLALEKSKEIQDAYRKLHR